MDFIAQNQTVIVSIISMLVVWLIGLIWKKNAEKSQIVSALTMILDIVMDIKNSPATSPLSDAEKKRLALKMVEERVPSKKVNLVQKVFGTVGGAVEFVYHNRKWLFAAAGKLVRAVF